MGAFLSADVNKVGTILQVTRSLAMSSKEGQRPADYYVDLGRQDGLGVGDTLAVYRDVPVVQGYAGLSASTMRLQMAEMVVAQVSESTCLARVTKLTDPSILPQLQFYHPGIGDRVEAKSRLPYR